MGTKYATVAFKKDVQPLHKVIPTENYQKHKQNFDTALLTVALKLLAELITMLMCNCKICTLVFKGTKLVSDSSLKASVILLW